MGSLVIGGIVFACTFGGALAGMMLRAVLPEHHVSTESKDVVKLGMGLIATLAALVLGLLIASAAAGNPNIVEELKQGKQLGNQTFKVHLDGYNQMDLITGKGPSKRHEIFYLTETTLSAVRIDDYKYRFTDQPNGWLGATLKVDWPILVNLRLDPFERTGMYNGKDNGSLAYYNWFVYEFWRFVFVQQEIGKAAQTLVEFPPMQKGASFNLEALKAELEKKMEMMRSVHSQ